MNRTYQSRPTHILVASIIAVGFGALTVFSGGSVIFFTEPARAAGNIVPFVVWFNFLAGFAYVIAGTGLFKWQRWGINLSIAIAALTLLVFAALGFHILKDGAFEMRTVIAMAFRFFLWACIALLANIAWKKIDRIT